MKKIFLFFIMAIMVTALSAQTTEVKPAPVKDYSQADRFVDKAITFVDKVVTGSTKVGDIVPGYKDVVESTATKQPRDTETLKSKINSKYDSEAYWTMIEGVWNSMASTFEGSKTKNSDFNNLRNGYVEKAAALSQEYLKDMVNADASNPLLARSDAEGKPLVDLYWKDFDALNKQYTNDINLLNAEDKTAEGNKQWFDPKTMLDKVATEDSMKKMGVRAELQYAGVGDKYLTSNIIQLIDRMKAVYGGRGYHQLEQDLNWFTTVWGAASELNVMAQQGFTVTGDDQMKRVDASYAINEYGVPQAETDSSIKNENTSGFTGLGGDKDKDGNLIPLSVYSLQDASYNNRSYGYYDGNYTTIVVTVANRQYQLYDHLYTSPIVLDMDGDNRLEASNGEWLTHGYKNARLAEFDINGDNFVELTEWVGPNDGLLIVCKKGEEVNANSLFGEAGGYKDGFEKLSLLDVDNNKQITGDELKTLSVWQDKNSNAKIEDGELATVAELGITSISINHEGLVASFVQNGTTKKLWDWFPAYFRAKQMRK